MEGQGAATPSAPTGGAPATPSTGASQQGTGGYGAVADATARDTGTTQHAEPETPEGVEGQETAAQAAARKFKYRKLTERGEYEDEEWDEDQVQKFLSDDWEDEYTIDGQKVRLPRHQARRNLQLQETSYRRMEEAKKIRESIAQREKYAAESPYDFIDEADGYKFSDTYDGLQVTKSDLLALKRAAELFSLVEMRNSDDPLKRSEYMVKERERTARFAEAQRKHEEKRREQEEQQRRRSEGLRQLQPEIEAALKAAGLRQNEANMRRMAKHVQRAKELGFKMSVFDAAQHAKQDWINDQRAEFAALDGGQLIATLGPELANKIRDHQIKTVERKQDAAAEAGGAKQREQSMKQITDKALKDATKQARGVSPMAFALRGRGR